MSRVPVSAELVEVSPRDGLQNEPQILSTPAKLELIRRALASGVKRIEVASFVHPARVPQMADAEAVCAGLPQTDATLIGLVLNRRGAERALATRVDELGTVVSASDGFGIINQGRSAEQTLADAIEIIGMAVEAGKRAQATISVAFGCPREGLVDPHRVIAFARRLADAGAHEIALADTIGVAAPPDVIRLMRLVKEALPKIPIRLHFHDTRNTAIANAWAGLGEGAATLDGSIGGIGGCPFAPGASGNVATEDLLYMLRRAGVATGLDFDAVVAASHWLGGALGRRLSAKLSQVPAFPAAILRLNSGRSFRSPLAPPSSEPRSWRRASEGDHIGHAMRPCG